jgi:hypothetical protein
MQGNGIQSIDSHPRQPNQPTRQKNAVRASNADFDPECPSFHSGIADGDTITVLTAEVIGNRGSRVYHKPTWRSVAAMAEKNRVTFDTATDAEKAGYRKAGDCWKGRGG